MFKKPVCASATALGLIALSIPARADLIEKRADPADQTTRAGGDSGAQVDSFWSDAGDWLKGATNKVIIAADFMSGAPIPQIPQAEVDDAQARSLPPGAPTK